MLDLRLDATVGMDGTIVYLTTVRPFDREGRHWLAAAEVVIVETDLEALINGR